MSTTQAQAPALLRLCAIAILLNVSERTVRRLVDRRRIPCIRISQRLMLFDPADVLTALKGGRR